MTGTTMSSSKPIAAPKKNPKSTNPSVKISPPSSKSGSRTSNKSTKSKKSAKSDTTEGSNNAAVSVENEPTQSPELTVTSAPAAEREPEPVEEVVAEKAKPTEPAPPPPYLHGIDPNAIHFEQWYRRLEFVLQGMQNELNLLDPKLLHGVFLFAKFTSTSAYGKELAEIWNSQLGKYGFGKIYARMMDQFYEKDHFTSVGTDPVSKAAYENFYHATRTMWNGSDSDEILCSQVWSCEIAEKCLKVLSNGVEKDESLIISEGRKWFMKGHISTLMNSLRRFPESGVKFRELGGVEIVLPFTESKDEIVSVVATCTIAYGSSEEQIKELNVGEKIIHFLLNQVLYRAILMKNRRYRGFSIEETLEVINKLAAHESIQERLCESKTLSTFFTILKEPKEEEELVQVTRLFWTLSFSAKIKEKCKEVIPGLPEELKKLEKHKDGKVRKAVQGALWNLEGSRPKTAGSRTTTTTAARTPVQQQGGLESYIMVSYDWKHKQVVLPLNQALKAAGYRTWVDVEQMSGSTLDAMADAVEKASLVLICVSERYKESPNCRAEAEYAFRLNKPIIPIRTQANYKPDGWLGMLMGTKLFFNCFEPEDVPDCAEKVVYEINRQIEPEKSVYPPADPLDSARPPAPFLPPIDSSENSVCLVAPAATGVKRRTHSLDARTSQLYINGEGMKTWDKAKVSSWLKSNKLESIAVKLKNFDGNMLHQLYNLYRTKSQVFMAMMDRLRIGNPEDILRFTSALEEQPHGVSIM